MVAHVVACTKSTAPTNRVAFLRYNLPISNPSYQVRGIFLFKGANYFRFDVLVLRTAQLAFSSGNKKGLADARPLSVWAKSHPT